MFGQATAEIWTFMSESSHFKNIKFHNTDSISGKGGKEVF